MYCKAITNRKFPYCGHIQFQLGIQLANHGGLSLGESDAGYREILPIESCQ